MRSYNALVFPILMPALLWADSVGAAGPLYINEVLASNAVSGKDPQGHYDDWIELYNAGPQAVDCGGMYLTDDPKKPQKWQIPTNSRNMTTIPAGGYLLVWADGDVGADGLHASFGLASDGDRVALYDRDGIILIDSIEFGAQTTDVSCGRLPDGGDQWHSLDPPTPGAKNISAYEGIVAKPRLSLKGGFYDGEIVVTISTATEGAAIYYTTDGSEPYVLGGRLPTGKLYTEPLRIIQTTCLRAKAVKPQWKSSTIATGTYLFIEDVVRQSFPGPGWPAGSVNGQVIDYGMDPDVVYNVRYRDLMDDALLAIPSISLVTKLDNLFGVSEGIYTHPSSEGRAAERPVSVELLHPDGSEGFQIDAGLRIRGGFSRSNSNPKHAFRLLFRPEYGQSKLKYPLFGEEGTDEFENIDLRTSQNYSWSFQGNNQNTMVREVFSRDVQGQMGHPYTRSRYYHLYLNGQYWGLYQSQERSEASYAESYLGGGKEDYDVVKVDRSVGRAMLATDGNMDAYRRLYDATMQGLGSSERYYRIQGLNPDGTPNPSYERLLDVDNLIDFMIIEYYTGDRDGPGSRFGNIPNNTFAIYNREAPDGWKWFHHDNEHTLGVSQSEINMVTPFTTAGVQWRYFNPHWLHEQLAQTNIDYRMHFADHVYRHLFNDGLLTPAASIARIQNRAKQIELAIIAESARWGDAKRDVPFTRQDWEAEVNRLIGNYLPTRTQIVLGQFKTVGWYPNIDPPTFNQRGGYISRSFPVQLAAGGGTIYYTLDGSDPRLPGGTINTTKAQIYMQPIRLDASAPVKARVLSGSTWSALSEAVFAVGPVAESLRISEIMYHPPEIPDLKSQASEAEYIELTNVGAETINLNRVRFTQGIEYTFPSYGLPPGSYCLLVKDIAAFGREYVGWVLDSRLNPVEASPDAWTENPPYGLPIVGQYQGNLSNGGERIELLDAAGGVIQSFEYRDDWFDLTDGQGYSLTIRDARAAVDPGDEAAWRPSTHAGGSPGTDDNESGSAGF